MPPAHLTAPHCHTPSLLISAPHSRAGITSVFNVQQRGEHPHCGPGLDPSSGFTYATEVFMQHKSEWPLHTQCKYIEMCCSKLLVMSLFLFLPLLLPPLLLLHTCSILLQLRVVSKFSTFLCSMHAHACVSCACATSHTVVNTLRLMQFSTCAV